MSKDLLAIKINLFGILREFSEKPNILCEIPNGFLIKDIREVILEELVKSNNNKTKISEILRLSAFSDGQEILEDSYVINKELALSVLPPVCGG